MVGLQFAKVRFYRLLEQRCWNLGDRVVLMAIPRQAGADPCARIWISLISQISRFEIFRVYARFAGEGDFAGAGQLAHAKFFEQL